MQLTVRQIIFRRFYKFFLHLRWHGDFFFGAILGFIFAVFFVSSQMIDVLKAFEIAQLLH